MTMLSMSSHSSVDRGPAWCWEVMGSIPGRDSDFFFAPCLCDVDQFTFHFITRLTSKIQHDLDLLIMCYIRMLTVLLPDQHIHLIQKLHSMDCSQCLKIKLI